MARLGTIFISNKYDILKISFKSTNNFVEHMAVKSLTNLRSGVDNPYQKNTLNQTTHNASFPFPLTPNSLPPPFPLPPHSNCIVYDMSTT